MSYKSTVCFLSLPNGGELHVYSTFDPALTDGHTPQLRLGVLIPACEGMPEGMDYDEPVPIGLQSAEGDRVLGRHGR